MSQQNTKERVLTKRNEQASVQEGGSKRNTNQLGKQMAKIIESEEVIVKQDCGFSKALIQARSAKNIKQVEFAQKIGIKETDLKAYENGQRFPSNPLIAKMEQILGAKLPRPKNVALQIQIRCNYLQ